MVGSVHARKMVILSVKSIQYCVQASMWTIKKLIEVGFAKVFLRNRINLTLILTENEARTTGRFHLIIRIALELKRGINTCLLYIHVLHTARNGLVTNQSETARRWNLAELE